MRKHLLLFLGLLLLTLTAFPQDTIKPLVVPGKILNGDTLPLIELNSGIVIPHVDISNSKELLRYDRLVYNVRIVYPYAKLAAQKLKEYRHVLDSLPNDRSRRSFIKHAQKELEDKFGKKIKEMTFNQGKILIKLIYRETGNSTYDLVKELRGGFNAFIWQTMAKLYGYDLHSPYDPDGDDKAIERIVKMIESGMI